MRGTETSYLHPPCFQRITPARAGNRDKLLAYFGDMQDHPRACGEQLYNETREAARQGSPPRVRGTVPPAGLYSPQPGITPARAGNRGSLTISGPLFGDHPRACGEQIPVTAPAFGHTGSPPRVRGTDEMGSPSSYWLRITPARAGNRNSTAATIWLPGDHPRACGEQQSRILGLLEKEGSPPRVRGTVISKTGRGWHYRITPARAGNSYDAPVDFTVTKDHPRACGEQHCTKIFPGSP